MAKHAKRRTDAPKTTAQQLGSLLKSARDVMRKDKGLSGDLDRLPMLTWIMFLKFLDDVEQVREAEARLEGKRFRPAIERPYRWRDWAAKEDGITGDELIAFINQEKGVVRPDDSKGAGLFAYLRSLQGTNGGDRRDVIATVFRGTVNRMQSGYLLRDVLNLVNRIHFASSEEIQVLGQLYESLLKETRDAAGDSGEFYTPRPLVRFVVTVVDPRLGETVLDPAAGTGGFLVAAFEHLKQQCRKAEHHSQLQRGTLFGVEPKPLPYLLCQMNLLLHGLELPEIDPVNALGFPLKEIGDKERVDVIITNPPFGGEEERGILGNFPEDKQTTETALLFLQLIMRKLRRPIGGRKAGRCGMVVPNGMLFGDGICARIKEELLKEFNLHTIVRLPNGVFAPYTSIPTNLLFFDRFGPTKEVWYYEHPLPEGRKNYTKTQPLQFEEFAPCIAWWRDRVENDRAWKVPAAQILANGSNLDIKNPNRHQKSIQLPPEQLAEVLVKTEREILDTIARVKEDVDTIRTGQTKELEWPAISLGEVLAEMQEYQEVDANAVYQNVGIYSFGRGLFEKPQIRGIATSAKVLKRIRKGQFIYSRLFAFEGAYGVVPDEFDGYFVSNEYPTFQCDVDRIIPEFLFVYFQSESVWAEVAEGSKGLGHRRQRVQPEQVLAHRLRLPPLHWQRQVLSVYEKLREARRLRGVTSRHLDALLPSILAIATKR